MSEVDADEPHSAAVEPQSYSDEEHAINVVKASEGSSSKPFIVYYNALSRVVMSGFLIAGGLYAIPEFFTKTPTADFTYCAIFFMIGTGLFLIAALIDFMSTVGNGAVAMNSSLYVLGTGALEAGSVVFHPKLGITDPIGQQLYIAGTCVVGFALLWVRTLE